MIHFDFAHIFQRGGSTTKKFFIGSILSLFSKHPYNFEKIFETTNKIPPQIIRFILPLFSKNPLKKKIPYLFTEIRQKIYLPTYLPPPFRCGGGKRRSFGLTTSWTGQAFSSRSCQGRRKSLPVFPRKMCVMAGWF